MVDVNYFGSGHVSEAKLSGGRHRNRWFNFSLADANCTNAVLSNATRWLKSRFPIKVRWIGENVGEPTMKVTVEDV